MNVKEETAIKKPFLVHLDELQKNKLEALALRSDLSMSAVVRLLIDGAAIREMPSVDYRAMTDELHKIGVNLNQMARAANAGGIPHRDIFEFEAARLRDAVLHIRQAVELG